MSIDQPEGESQELESAQEMEVSKLDRNMQELSQNLDQVESAPPDRLKKIVDFLMKDQSLLVAAGPMGLVVKEMAQGNWDEALLMLGIATAAVGGYKFVMNRAHRLRNKPE